MRLHASFLLALFALHARAATIQGPAVLELEKKLPSQEPSKDVIPPENASSEQELIDSANTVKDIENNLRVKAIDSIPVSVIVESDVNPTSDNEVTPDIKRSPIDLKNPGEPQRQEHETQNAIHYDEEQQIVTTVKQTVVDTQNALKQGFQGVTQGIQDWIANSEQLSAIQASIHNLQESFQNQINKLNDTLQTFWQNRLGTNPQQAGSVDSKPEMQTVETHLKTLEDNFQKGVKALSEGVEVFATLKAENENPTSPTPSAPNNLFLQYLQLFQQTISQGFNNVTHAFQNYVSTSQSAGGTSSPGILQGLNNGIQNIFNQGGNQPAGAQSDEAAQKPSLWQGIQSSIQNILKPSGQAAQGSNGGAPPNRPITQAIQNLPFVQGVVSLIQPNKPAQPSKPSSDPVQPAAEGSNVVPAETKPEADQQQPAKSPADEEVKPEAGPIQSIIQNNAIVKGISGAVQKLQASISNPEKPRETEKETDNEKGDTKGGFHGGYNNYNAGDNNDDNGSSDSGVAVKSDVPAAAIEKVEETVPEKPTAVEVTRVESDKTDKS